MVDFGGAAIGALFGQLLNLILSPVCKALKFKKARKNLQDTVERLNLQVAEMRTLNGELEGRPREETDRMSRELDESLNLVSRYSNIRCWQVFCLSCYQDQLQAMEDSLRRSVDIMGVGTGNNVMRVLQQVRNSVGRQFRGLCKPPANPDFIVGFDEPFNKSKIHLLKEGPPVLVLTGPGGSGKTTLAKKLCWDEQVRDKFGENILYVTFSQSPDLKSIVQKLFQHHGYEKPEFQANEDASNGLVHLFHHIGKSPIFLVLDDVWPGPDSESLFEKLKTLSCCTILVTSRFKYPRFGTACRLKPIGNEDATELFRHYLVQENDSNSFVPNDNYVQKVVRGCRGSPLALKVIGGALSKQPFEVWHKMVKELSKGRSIVESNKDLLNRLKKSLDVLESVDVSEPSTSIKDSFMYLGLFPEDRRIAVAALIDMWTELYSLDEDGIETVRIVHQLSTRNLADLLITRKAAGDSDEFKYYNNHFVKQHDLLRDLAINLSSQEPFEQRKILNIHINGNKLPEWWQEEKQQQVVAARTLSISTDETFTWDRFGLQADETEVLVLNFFATKYLFPEFMQRMRRLKVLIVTNYGSIQSELNNFDLLRSLSDLKRIRLAKVSVPFLCQLENLKKLSLYMCNINQALQNCNISISDAMPNLVEMNIDYCNDLLKLPPEISKSTPLKKLSITNCHNFSDLPEDIGKLENLEVLRLSACSDLVGIPDSITGLSKLCFLDISDCISLKHLPEEFGGLSNLRKFCMKGCESLQDLPSSVTKFEDLQHEMRVVCDTKACALWEVYKPSLPNVLIEVPNVVVDLDWLREDP